VDDFIKELDEMAKKKDYKKYNELVKKYEDM
jgi:hypothetical protein